MSAPVVVPGAGDRLAHAGAATGTPRWQLDALTDLTHDVARSCDHPPRSLADVLRPPDGG